MSEFKCRESGGGGGGSTRTSTKQSKPFCSLAYLAKSTAAINGNNDIRIIKNGHGNHNQLTTLSPSPSPSRSPNEAAATAKVNERSSPALPTGALTNTTNSSITNGHECKQNGHATNNEDAAAAAATKLQLQQMANGHINNSNVADIFGVINEEEQITTTTTWMACNEDEVDAAAAADVAAAATDSLRPWELSNSYVKHIPPSLMTAAMPQNGFSNGHSNGGLTSLSKLNSLDCWDYTIELECLKGPQDLQLAAELGKTLLERNKELETLLKEHKNTIDEQEQEILYLKKHTTALREVNDSRLKVYEQLEVGIQDLERANHRLIVESSSDKKHLKSFVQNIETLESRCDELTKQLEESRQALSMERRKNERLTQEKNGSGSNEFGVHLKPLDNSNSMNITENGSEGFNANTIPPENCSFAFRSSEGSHHNANSTGVSGCSSHSDHHQSLDLSMVCSEGEENEEIIKIVHDVEMTKKAFLAEQQRCAELEEQLVAIIQENQTLQSRIAQTSNNEEMKSMQEELSILDEVRQGQMCSRCLRAVEDRATVNDEQSSIAPTEEGEDDDERSLLDLDGNRDENASEHSQGAYRSSVSIKITPRLPHSLDLNAPASPNPYRDLVEKYEALLEVQRSSIARKSNSGGNGGNCMSLAEEFQSVSGEFNQTQKLMMQAAAAAVANGACNSSSNGDGASSCNGSTTNETAISNKAAKNNVHGGRTPTEFSEAETSSSGYSDETSNKFTQTDDRPGYFLCSIGDGEDCKFSIYDDISPIDSRFRNRPEYRELFKEIFAVLKKAADNKEEGDKLPLLDDTHPVAVTGAGAGATAKVPPVTPANEELPVDFADDAQSIVSSAVSEQSFAMSECITKLERKTAKKHIIEKNQENLPPSLATSRVQLTASPSTTSQLLENGRVLTPLKREPLEYLSVGVGIKKKNRKKNRNYGNDRSESPVALPSPPRFFVSSGKKRKDVRPLVPSPMASEQSTSGGSRSSRGGGVPKYEWNGSSMVIYNRSLNSPHQSGPAGDTRRELDLNSIEYRPSTVSQDLHKLKKLDLSYAEVLRRADACKQHHHHQHQQHQSQRRRHQH